MMKLFLVMTLCFVPAFAQIIPATPTQPELAQVRPPQASKNSLVAVWLPAAGGQREWKIVELDSATIELVEESGKLVLRAKIPAVMPVNEATEDAPYILTTLTNSITLAATPVGGKVKVFRNGVKLTKTVDYTVAGNVLTFVAGQKPCEKGCAATEPEIVTVEYVR